MRIILTLLCMIVSVMAFAQTTDTNIKYRIDGIGTAAGDGKGIWFANTANAALGAQQYSPSMVLEGQGWATAGTSQSVKFMQDVVPVQGSANPSGIWRLRSSINNAAYSTVPIIQANSDGTVLIGGPTITPATRLDVRGVSGGNSFRVADNANTANVLVTDAGAITLTSALNSAILSMPANGVSSFSSIGLTLNSTGGGNALTMTTNGGGFSMSAGNTTIATSTIATSRTLATTGTLVHDYFRNTATINAPSTGQFTFINPAFTFTNYGGSVTGYDWNPVTPANIAGTHLAWRNTSGNMLIGGTTLSSASALVDMQSTTKGIVLPRVTNIASITAPVNGMAAYDATTNLFNFRQNGAWVGLGGGITNTAAANEIPKSNGTNLVPSGVFSTTAGNLELGTGLGGSDRTISAVGSSSVYDLIFVNKGGGRKFYFNTTSGNAIISPGGSANALVIEGGLTSQVFLAGNSTNFSVGLIGGPTTVQVTSGEQADLSVNSANTNIKNTGNVSIKTGDGIGGNLSTGNITLTTGVPTGTGNPGDIILNPQTGFLKISEAGSAPSMGTATLVGGTITVSNSKVTANTRIFLTHQNNSGTVGFVTVSARAAGTSFTITSSSGSDTSTIAWMLIEPN